jgi:heme exporter protein A
MLCGLLPPASGAIFWRGDPLTALREAYHPFVRYVGHGYGMKDELTTMENLRVSCALSGDELSHDEAREVLERLTLSREAHLQARYLSTGQRRRLALARLLGSPAQLWLLDEVFSGLDDAATRLTASIVDDHLARGGLAVIATHHDLRLAACSSRRIELAA